MADDPEVEFDTEPRPEINPYPTVYTSKRWRKTGLVNPEGEELVTENRPPLGFLTFDWHEEPDDDEVC